MGPLRYTLQASELFPSLDYGSLSKLPRFRLPRFHTPRRKTGTAPTEPRWRPMTLQTRFLAFLISISLLLCLLILSLEYYSARNSGITDFRNDAGFRICWTYLPTALATIYSIMWGLVDYDAKRTEPFARLSRPGGCSAKYSIFLMHAFPGLQVIRALSKKKGDGRISWTMVWTGLGYLLAFLVLVPLSSGLMEPGIVATVTMEGFQSFQPFNVRNPITTANERLEVPYFSTMAAIGRGVNTSLWTTDKYFVTPFWPPAMDRPSGARIPGQNPEIWTGNTPVYSAKLVCTPLKTRFRQPDEPGANNMTQLLLYDGRGCEATVYGLTRDTVWEGGTWARSDFQVLHLGQLSRIARLLRYAPDIGSGCEGQLLFYRDSAKDLTAASMCTGQFFSADMSVTIHTSGTNSTIQLDNPELFDARAELLPEGTFNSSGFIHKSFLIDELHYTTKPTPGLGLTGYSNGLEYLTAKIDGPLIYLAGKYSDTSFLAVRERLEFEAQQVFQRFFAEFMDTTVNRIANGSKSTSTQRTRQIRRLVVNKILGTLVSSFLIFNAVLAIAICVSADRRELGLYKDMATIAEMATLVLNSDDVEAMLAGMDGCTEEQMADLLKDCTLKLKAKYGKYQLKLKNPETLDNPAHFWITRANTNQKSREEDWRPLTLRFWFCLCFLAVIVAYFAAMLYLWDINTRTGGLGRLGLWLGKDLHFGGSVVSLYSIVPTALALLVKLPWISLDETFRRLQPFSQLAKEPSNPRRTVVADLNLPVPLWSTFLTASTGYWFAALITVGSFGMEFLTIGMAAMFERGPAIITQDIQVNQTMEPLTSLLNFGNISSILSAGTYSNFQYQAMISTAWNGTLPPWTTPEYAIIPVNVSLPADGGLNSSGNWTMETTALYAEAICKEREGTVGWFSQVSNATHPVWGVQHFPDGGYKPNVWFQPKRYFVAPNPEGQGALKQLFDWQGAITPTGFQGFWGSLGSRGDSSFNVSWIKGDVGGLDEDGYWVFATPPIGTFLTCTTSLFSIQAKVTIDPVTKLVLRTQTIGQGAPITNSSTPISQVMNDRFPTMGLASMFTRTLCEAEHVYDNDGGMREYYNMVERGLWMDYMSYSMYANHRSDPSALLDPPTLAAAVNATIKTYFSHFAAKAESPHAYWAYQNKTAPTLSTGVAEQFADQLVMSASATYICLSVMGFAAAALMAYFWERSRFRFLRRDYSTVGSVLTAVFASRRLLDAIRGTERLIGEDTMEWMKGNEYGMGFFNANGRVHYGIEQEPLMRGHRGRKRRDLPQVWSD